MSKPTPNAKTSETGKDVLVEEMPPGLLEAWGKADVPAICLKSDLTSKNRFGNEWLVADDSSVSAWCASGPGFTCRADLDLAKVKEVKTESLVGAGALLAVMEDATVELVRYTPSEEPKFKRAARRLSSRIEERNGKACKETDADEKPGKDSFCPNCGLPFREGTRICANCFKRGKTIRRLVVYLKPYWKQTLALWFLVLSIAGLGLIPPYLNRPLIDNVINPKTNLDDIPSRIRLLGLLVLGLLVSRVLLQAAAILQGRMIAWIGARLSHDLRTELYKKLQALSIGYFDKQQSGGLVSRVTQDTLAMQHAILEVVPFVGVNALTLVGIMIVLFVMNWQLACLILIPVPLVVILSRLFWRTIRKLWHRFFHLRQALNARVQDSLSGIRVTRAFAAEEQEIDRFHSQSQDLADTEGVVHRLHTTLFPVLAFLTVSGGLFVWYFGGRKVISGELTLGTMMAFLSYLAMFYGPLQMLSRIADWLTRALTSAERVFEVLDTPSEVREPENPVSIGRIEGKLDFVGVSFGYDEHKPVLKDMNFSVKPGEMIGLVGHSGAGKSTTINVLSRFYDVNEGCVQIDGIDIRKLSQHDLRSQIGMVPQDPFLFTGSIAQNIAYAKPDASPMDIMGAAKAANAHDFIVKKPDGYDTLIGERGQMLSGGERQRVAIARAILHDPRILILDEATSLVDTDAEQQIQEAVARLVKGRTTIAIAHRLSTLRNADRLIVLKDGEIIETGTHKELLDKEGEFHRLVEIQQKISKIQAVER